MRKVGLLVCVLSLLLVTGEAFAKRQVQMPPKGTRMVSGKGDIGLSFAFAGLGTLAANGVGARTVGAAAWSILGLEFVLSSKLHIGLVFGLGLNSLRVSDDERNNDWGVDIGGTLQYNLVTWKHLTLYLGGNLTVGVLDLTGKNNTAINITLAPKIGVQWFFTHMMSLSAEYLQNVVFSIVDGKFQNAGFSTAAGGTLRLTAYF